MYVVVWSSSYGRKAGVVSVRLLTRAPRPGVARCEYSCSHLGNGLYERILSTVLTTSTRGVVIAIENGTQNVHKQP